MRCWLPAIGVVACLLALSLPHSGGTAARAQAVVFEDRFEGGRINEREWLIEHRAGNAQGTPRAELQYYTPNAVRVGHGPLRIETATAHVFDPKTGITFAYVSGRIQTRRTFLYGRFEFRARVPRGRGLAPALWLRTPPKLPFDGEIDVIESYGSHPNIVQSTLHPWINGREPRQYCAWLLVRPQPDSPRFHRPDCERIDKAISLPNDLATDFHVYAIEWTPDRVTWSLDGAAYFTVRERIPHVPMIIVINMAISPNWDGVPDRATVLPQTFDIAYVRVTALR